MSILIVGLMLVAALHTVGASKLAQSHNAQAALGPILADEMMAEILNRAYEEPVDSATFGLEGESATVREDWDDVDDYHGWSATPPQQRDGTSVPGADGWTRAVAVTWVTQDGFVPTVLDTGLKQIDVTLVYNGRTVTTLSALRTSGWPEDGEEAAQDEGIGQSSQASQVIGDLFK